MPGRHLRLWRAFPALPVALACASPVSPADGAASVPAVRDGGTGLAPLPFRGTGTTDFASDPSQGVPRLFFITALDRETASEALHHQTIHLWRNGASPPQTGQRYVIAPPNFTMPDSPSFAATFGREYGGSEARAEYFVAHAGEVQFTKVAADRVEGAFRLEATQVCSQPAPSTGRAGWGQCGARFSPPSGAPKVTVSGSFVATPPEKATTTPGGE